MRYDANSYSLEVSTYLAHRSPYLTDSQAVRVESKRCSEPICHCKNEVLKITSIGGQERLGAAP